jgi:hypothetical protein
MAIFLSFEGEIMVVMLIENTPDNLRVNIIAFIMLIPFIAWFASFIKLLVGFRRKLYKDAIPFCIWTSLFLAGYMGIKSGDKPENIFAGTFGEAPSSEIRNLQTTYDGWFMDSGDTYIRFEASPRTFQRLRLKLHHVPSRTDSAYTFRSNQPSWWHNSEGACQAYQIEKEPDSQKEHDSPAHVKIEMCYFPKTETAYYHYSAVD